MELSGGRVKGGQRIRHTIYIYMYMGDKFIALVLLLWMQK